MSKGHLCFFQLLNASAVRARLIRSSKSLLVLGTVVLARVGHLQLDSIVRNDMSGEALCRGPFVAVQF